MPKFSRNGLGRKSGGTVTVLETKVHRSSARNARVAFILTAIVVALLTMTIGSDNMHPILALLLGIGLGAVLGGIVWGPGPCLAGAAGAVVVDPGDRVRPHRGLRLDLPGPAHRPARAPGRRHRLGRRLLGLPPVRRRVWSLVLCVFVR